MTPKTKDSGTVVRRKLKIINKLGLHARAATLLVKVANKYKSKVELIKDGERANGKSILGVLTLAAACGDEIELIVEGPDADRCAAEIEDLVRRKFDEGE